MTELYPGFHRVPVVGSNAFLIVDQDLTLIDAGSKGSGRMIAPYIRRIGRRPDEVKLVLLTHTHPDHSGGLDEVRLFCDAAIAVHASEAHFMRGDENYPNPFQRPWLAAAARPAMTLMYPSPVEVDRELQDGDHLDLYGGTTIVHSPGHTPGSICLYFERHRMAVAGDAMEYRRGRLSEPNPQFTADPVAARESIRRLGCLALDTILLSHFRPVHRAHAKLRRLVQSLEGC